MESITILTSTTDDTINIQSTRANSTYNIDPRFGVNVINVGADAPNLLTPGVTNLDGILGPIRIGNNLGTTSLNVSDFGAAVGDTYLVEETGANDLIGNPTTRVAFDGVPGNDDLLFNTDIFDDTGTAIGGGTSLANFRLIGSNTGDNI